MYDIRCTMYEMKVESRKLKAESKNLTSNQHPAIRLQPLIQHPELDCMLNILQLFKQSLIVLFINIHNDVTNIVVGH